MQLYRLRCVGFSLRVLIRTGPSPRGLKPTPHEPRAKFRLQRRPNALATGRSLFLR
jgi:hypothetical protein